MEKTGFEKCKVPEQNAKPNSANGLLRGEIIEAK
jgi:hypothetical protein